MYLELEAMLKRTEMRSWGKERQGGEKLDNRSRDAGKFWSVLRAQPRVFQRKPVPLSLGILHRPGDKQETRMEEPQLAS